MIAVSTDVADVTKPRRRETRRRGDQSPKSAPAPLPKHRDPSKTKVSFYLDNETAEKLVVEAMIRSREKKVDLSDVANDIIKRAVSSVVCYRSERSDSTLTTGGDRQDAAA